MAVKQYSHCVANPEQLRVGQQVDRGGLIGTVYENETDEPVPMWACVAGLVLGLKATPRVSVGDPLAVILEDLGTEPP